MNCVSMAFYERNNAMKWLLLSMTALLAACNAQPTKQAVYKETAACSNYRGMMTAPMPPDAMARLKQECINSQQNKN